jgi:hypothetical protein
MIKKSQNCRKQVFLFFFACLWKVSGGPKTYGSYGSGSCPLVETFHVIPEVYHQTIEDENLPELRKLVPVPLPPHSLPLPHSHSPFRSSWVSACAVVAAQLRSYLLKRDTETFLPHTSKSIRQIINRFPLYLLI